MTTAAAKRDEQREALERLREWIKPGDTIFTDLRHVSASGMQRTIQLISLKTPDSPSYYGWNAAKGCGWSYDEKREGIKIRGCGMDMGYALVYDLAFYLWPNGWQCIGPDCMSNTHSNREQSPRDGSMLHTDGYALRHRWL